MAGDSTKNRNRNEEKLSVKINKINPKTENQEIVFREFQAGQNLILTGSAGTGKSFISIYLALKHIYESNKINKLIIVRSAVPTRDQGFLPGDLHEKEEVYKIPYISIVNELCYNDKVPGSPYHLLEKNHIIKFMTTSFIRGITIDNAIVIVDECQNMTWHEYYSIMTRLGENSRIIFCGDTKQDDFKNARKRELSGLENMIFVADEIFEFSRIEFDTDDIVRSGIVKKFIEVCEKRNL